MRAWISLALMFVAVAALGTWVYYRPQSPTAESHALSELKRTEVRTIRLERPAQPAGAAGDAAHAPALEAAVVLERKEDAWRMIEPLSARTDPFQVERLLSILDTRSMSRYPASDPARYGLEPPQAKLTLNDQAFSYGAVNTVTREQYVLTRDAVYAIPLAQRNALPRDANALLAKTLVAADEMPVRVELPGFTASLESGSWSIAPAPEHLGADERNAWADAWRRAIAVQAARHDGSKPEATVSVRLKDGRTIAIGILRREPELVLVRADEGVQYHFFVDAGKRLLSPPGTRNEGKTK